MKLAILLLMGQFIITKYSISKIIRMSSNIDIEDLIVNILNTYERESKLKISYEDKKRWENTSVKFVKPYVIGKTIKSATRFINELDFSFGLSNSGDFETYINSDDKSTNSVCEVFYNHMRDIGKELSIIEFVKEAAKFQKELVKAEKTSNQVKQQINGRKKTSTRTTSSGKSGSSSKAGTSVKKSTTDSSRKKSRSRVSA